MKHRLCILAGLILLGLYGSPAWSNKLEQIRKDGLRVCLDPSYMPFETLDKQGSIIGFDPDLAALMVKELGAPKLDMVKTAWDDIIPSLMANKCDIIMSGMSVTEERSQKIAFSNAYVAIGQTALIRKELAAQVKSHSDLNEPKYKVMSKRNTTGEAAVKAHLPKAQYIAADSEDEAISALIGGKVDAFVFDSPYNAVAFGRHTEGKLAFLDSPFTIEPIGWGISKDHPDLLRWANEFLAKIQKDGTRYTLYKKWFKSTEWLKDVP
ncbi:MAG: transporter substrate-binding domain-containing protein [Candidatus Competibacteraceae bacterium]|nr:transporter substrate-binding domain-containing protein [Candidatus Competibacteraceae bacterium]